MSYGGQEALHLEFRFARLLVKLDRFSGEHNSRACFGCVRRIYGFYVARLLLSLVGVATDLTSHL